MDFLLGVLMALSPFLVFPLMTGLCAQCFNRKFWPWFIAGFFLPFIGVIIVLCLPEKKERFAQQTLAAVSSEEIFEPVLEENTNQKINGNEIHFSARA
jgi:hypothetical protein